MGVGAVAEKVIEKGAKAGGLKLAVKAGGALTARAASFLPQIGTVLLALQLLNESGRLVTKDGDTLLDAALGNDEKDVQKQLSARQAEAVGEAKAGETSKALLQAFRDQSSIDPQQLATVLALLQSGTFDEDLPVGDGESLLNLVAKGLDTTPQELAARTRPNMGPLSHLEQGLGLGSFSGGSPSPALPAPGLPAPGALPVPANPSDAPSLATPGGGIPTPTATTLPPSATVQ